MSKNVLITGGAGYIGSHACLELLKADFNVLVFDNLSNGSREALNHVQDLAGRAPQFIKGDITSSGDTIDAFEIFRPDCVMHFAGVKSVSESVSDPLKYYNVNFEGTRTLLEAMSKYDCKKIIFSSSAAVYGAPAYLPFDERHPVSPVNPYGRSKLMVETMLKDWTQIEGKNRRAVCLRYFNPIGAHPSGLIGEHVKTDADNIMPHIVSVARGEKEYLSIFGDDYSTSDGTGERDYIHVVDLARGHVQALRKINNLSCFQVFNLGTGRGTTVKALVSAYEKASGRRINVRIESRRNGDVASCWADTKKANEILDFECLNSLNDMCRDVLNWQNKNPFGYTT